MDKYQKDALRKKWAEMPRHGAVAFESLEDFRQWCEETGWEIGMKLARKDKEKPYSRENCYWITSGSSVSYTYNQDEMAAEWERCIGPIREQYRDQIAAVIQKQRRQQVKEVFRYEHPDLVREGIVWQGK